MAFDNLSPDLRGGCCVVAAAMVFAVVGLIVKEDTLPPLIASEFRFLICWIMAAFFMLKSGKDSGLCWFGPPELRSMILVRGFLTSGFVMLWWTAIRMAPLGDCIAIIYTSPVLTVVLSKLVLGENWLRTFPIQAICAIAGVFFIAKPPFMADVWPEMFAVAQDTASKKADYRLVYVACVVSAWMPIATRQTKACSWIEVEHVTAALAVFVIHPVLFLLKGFPDIAAVGGESGWGAVLVVLAAVGSFTGVAIQTQGYQLADPGKACMFGYLEIPFGYVLQTLCTSAPLNLGGIVGSCLVLASCLLGIFEQLRLQRVREKAEVEAVFSPNTLAANVLDKANTLAAKLLEKDIESPRPDDRILGA
jgi:drug/metabolite transporter (DMT)-like permease